MKQNSFAVGASNFAPSPINKNILVDRCNPAGWAMKAVQISSAGTVAITDAEIFGEGCELTVLADNTLWINIAEDGETAIWRPISSSIQFLGKTLIDFNVQSYFSLPISSLVGAYQVGETIESCGYIDYSSETGAFLDGETVQVSQWYTINYTTPGAFLAGETLTGQSSGATFLVYDLYSSGNDHVRIFRQTGTPIDGEIFDNGSGVQGNLYKDIGTNANILGVITTNGDTGTRLRFNTPLLGDLDTSAGFAGDVVRGLTTLSLAIPVVSGGYTGGDTAEIVSIASGVLVIKNPVPIPRTPFVPIPSGTQINGQTSNATSITGSSTVIGNDQHIELLGGEQFIITTILLANPSVVLSQVGEFYIYDAPNRQDNNILDWRAHDISDAITTLTSYKSANAYTQTANNGLSSYALTKEVGKDLYATLDVPQGTPATAEISIYGYITG